jgi:hypothetical protein
VIQQLWCWAEELHLNSNEIENNLFLAVYMEGNTAIYRAACTGNKELLEGLLRASKIKLLNPDDMRKLLVAAWHNAAARGYLDLLERKWLWAGDVQ